MEKILIILMAANTLLEKIKNRIEIHHAPKEKIVIYIVCFIIIYLIFKDIERNPEDFEDDEPIL